jgi:predicted nucleic acid-binding protein
MNYVLDAGIAVALFAPQPFTDHCIAFVGEALAKQNVTFFAPDCIYYEVAAALRKYDRLGAYFGMDEDLQRVYDLPIAITSCNQLMQSAAKISREHLISPYDAFYLALSQRDGIPLVTADERLANGTQGKGFDVRHISHVNHI